MKDCMENRIPEEIKKKISEVAGAMDMVEARAFASALPWEVLIEEVKGRYERMSEKIDTIEKAINNI